jgi:hypothetical protein
MLGLQNTKYIKGIHMFFYEGCTVLGQLPEHIINSVRDYVMGIDYTEDRFKRTEPALKYNSYIISVPPPYTMGAAYKFQNPTDIDFSKITPIIEELKTWPMFRNMTVFAAEVNYLLPDQALLSHTDVRFYHLCGRRVQIPLLTDDSYFVSRDRPFKLTPPNVYEIDNISMHYANNKSKTTPKVSILIDWLDSSMIAEEEAANRSVRRRVLYYSNTTPETDSYS